MSLLHPLTSTLVECVCALAPADEPPLCVCDEQECVSLSFQWWCYWTGEALVMRAGRGLLWGHLLWDSPKTKRMNKATALLGLRGRSTENHSINDSVCSGSAVTINSEKTQPWPTFIRIWRHSTTLSSLLPLYLHLTSTSDDAAFTVAWKLFALILRQSTDLILHQSDPLPSPKPLVIQETLNHCVSVSFVWLLLFLFFWRFSDEYPSCCCKSIHTHVFTMSSSFCNDVWETSSWWYGGVNYEKELLLLNLFCFIFIKAGHTRSIKMWTVSSCEKRAE